VWPPMTSVVAQMISGMIVAETEGQVHCSQAVVSEENTWANGWSAAV
jgi:hypothetical protein